MRLSGKSVEREKCVGVKARGQCRLWAGALERESGKETLTEKRREAKAASVDDLASLAWQTSAALALVGGRSSLGEAGPGGCGMGLRAAGEGRGRQAAGGVRAGAGPSLRTRTAAEWPGWSAGSLEGWWCACGVGGWWMRIVISDECGVDGSVESSRSSWWPARCRQFGRARVAGEIGGRSGVGACVCPECQSEELPMGWKKIREDQVSHGVLNDRIGLSRWPLATWAALTRRTGCSCRPAMASQPASQPVPGHPTTLSGDN